MNTDLRELAEFGKTAASGTSGVVYAEEDVIGPQPRVENLQTWCSRGGDCEAGEPRAVSLKRDAVIFVQFESWSTLAY